MLALEVYFRRWLPVLAFGDCPYKACLKRLAGEIQAHLWPLEKLSFTSFLCCALLEVARNTPVT